MNTVPLTDCDSHVALKIEAERLRPEVKAALEAADEAVHDTMNLDGENDHALANLGYAYKTLRMDEEATLCFDEAIAYVERYGSQSFPFTVILLSQNGHHAGSDSLVTKWLADTKAASDKDKAGILSDIIMASMLSERPDWLSRVARMMPDESQYRDATLQGLSNAWASLRNPKDAFAAIQKMDSDSSKANAWARLACTFAYTDQQDVARHALRNAEDYLTGLPASFQVEESSHSIFSGIAPLMSEMFDDITVTDSLELHNECVRAQVIEAYLALGEIDVARKLFEETQLSEGFVTLYNGNLALQLAKRGRFNEAIGVADRMPISDTIFRDSSEQQRLLTLASIGSDMAKAGHTVDARLVLLEVWESVKQDESYPYAFLRVANALAESGFTDDSLLAYKDLYQSYVKSGKPDEWVRIVANSITNQAKAGLAYEPISEVLSQNA